jgi:hypothetical protein
MLNLLLFYVFQDVAVWKAVERLGFPIVIAVIAVSAIIWLTRKSSKDTSDTHLWLRKNLTKSIAENKVSTDNNTKQLIVMNEKLETVLVTISNQNKVVQFRSRSNKQA